MRVRGAFAASVILLCGLSILALSGCGGAPTGSEKVQPPVASETASSASPDMVSQAGSGKASPSGLDEPSPTASETASPRVGAARAQRRRGNLNGAITELQTAVAESPTELQAHFELGTAYYENGQYDEAIKEFASVIAENSSNLNGHSNLAASYFQKAPALGPARV